MYAKNEMTVSSSNPSAKRATPMKNKKLYRFGSLALASLMAAACGFMPTTDIDRVQPNYVRKDMFKGEWYSRALIVQKQYTNAMLFEGFEGELERIRWEITESQLQAYRSYEMMPGEEADDPGEQTMIAAFPIVSHFDIRRQYNAANGVENNVIEENTVDRPWWDREYMRVDWSTNVAQNIFTVAGFVRESAPITVNRNTNNDPTNPWKVRLSNDYVETTIDAIMEPDIYTCWSLGAEVIHCPGANVKMKFSFMKRDASHDSYEPVHYPDRVPQRYGLQENIFGDVNLCFEGDDGCDLRELWIVDTPFGTDICDPNIHDVDNCFQYMHDVFTRFGFFRTERYAWDRENGATLAGREQLINRWHIWEESLDSNNNPIPYAQRQPKSVVYYTNVGFPESLWEATQEQAHDWNLAFLDTIAALQGKTIEQVEQEYGTGGEPFKGYEVRRNDCNAENLASYVELHRATHDLEMDLMTHGFELDDLGPGNLEAACAVVEHYSMEAGIQPAFHWQQLGDLRYSFINWVATPEPAGPLGYGPSAADPVTGEIVSANANIYGASLDTYANWGGDVVQLLNGELDDGDIINGTHIREYVEQVRARARQPIDRQVGKDFISLFDERTGGLSEDQFLPVVPVAQLNINQDLLAGTHLERERFVTEEAVRLFGGVVGADDGTFTEEQIKKALPSTWGRAQVPPALRPNAKYDQVTFQSEQANIFQDLRDRKDAFGRNNFCYFVDEIEPAVADLAYDLRGKTREQAVQIIRHNIMRGVLAHEVGHTVGLRHNFEGSSDPLNFFPGYWDVDTGDVRDNAYTERKDELAYSSIMDYHQRFNGDFGSIGLYDRAAIKFGYGNLLEVFDERNESFIPTDWSNSLFLFYPDDLPYLLAGGDANDLVNEKYNDVIDDLYYNGNDQGFVDIKDLGITPKPENLFKRRNVTFQTWARQDVQRYFGIANNNGSPLLTDVPYAFCSDAFAWGGNLTCNRFDKGATSEEIVKNATEMYEFYYPFYTYMGARREDPVSPWFNAWLPRLRDRFLQPLRNAFTYFYYYRRSTAQIWPFILDWSIASHQGLNQLASIIQRPEPGRYCQDNMMYVPEGDLLPGQNCDAPVDIDLGYARPFESTFTNEFEFRWRNVGHMWDKLMAINFITSNDAFFYRDFSNQVDRSAFNISYYRVFQDELMSLFEGLILDGDNGRAKFAPQVDPDTGDIVFNPLVNFRGQQPTPTVGPLIKPSSSYYLQRQSLLWAMLGFSNTLDQTLDFAQRSKISVVGEANDPVILNPNISEAIFTDPTTGLQYHAYETDGAGRSLGYDMLMEAQDWVDGEWSDAKAELDAATVVKDTQPAAYTQALARFGRADRVLNDKMDMIELTRDLTNILEASH